MSPRHRPSRTTPAGNKLVESRLRVIGGQFRGRTIHYNGDMGLRPMKDRVREAVFNLIGLRGKGHFAIDLFGGTGAMAFEALSRGAGSALVFERNIPNARCIEQTARELAVDDRLEVRTGDTLIQIRLVTLNTSVPWLVFCCPPYELYVSRRADLIALVQRLWEQAPVGSVLVLESDERFEPASAFPDWIWDVRTYSPATIGIVEKTH